MNGRFVPWKDAKVHVMTHALHYGTSAFEGIRAYPSGEQMNVFRLPEHVRRLANSCRMFGFELRYSEDELCKAVVDTVRKNGLHVRSYIRPIVFVGFGGIGINFSGFPVETAIMAFPFEKYFHQEGVSVQVSSWRRTSDETGYPLAKIGGQYSNSVLGKMEALRNGYDESIMLDLNGYVSEGTGENLFLVRNGQLLTPHLSSSILEGITRDSVITLAAHMGIETVQRRVSRSELYVADEAFFSGTAAEITPILSIDKKKVGDGQMGPVTARIKAALTKVTKGEDPKYSAWLTPVY
jgi:branched-chain amino acid aminotransferase